MDDQQKAVYFISDAHLGSGSDLDLRRETLIEFLASIKQRASHLYILGDLFDFWFEYRHAIPKGHFRVLRALSDLIDNGTATFYFGGNHDFWCGSYLRQEVGVKVHQQPQIVEHQGRRIYLAHGDGIGPGDTGYRLMKALLRHPLAIKLYRAIHPDLGIPLAYFISRKSRNHTRPHHQILQHMARYLVEPRYDAGDNAVVIGHIHDPTHLTDSRQRDFLIIGDWLKNFSYVRLEQGVFTLERYHQNGGPELVPPLPWPQFQAGPTGPTSR